jgi:hypothetical protein
LKDDDGLENDADVVSYTGGKFATDINDTGGKQWD